MVESRLAQLLRSDDRVRTQDRTQDAPERVHAHPVVGLQRQLGNAQVARMIAQRQEAGEAEEEELQAKHDPALAQRQEAEEEELQAKHDPRMAQRQEAGEAEEEEMMAKHDPQMQREAEEEELQMKAEGPTVGLEGGPVGPEIQEKIESTRGGGSELDGGMRSKMEGAFGTSFEGVKVHRDSESDSLNKSITAKAFTTGNDIYLRNDSSPSDEKLMSHELTHVVQQRSMGGSGGGMQVGAADNSYEQEADAVAGEVVQSLASRKYDE